MNEPLSFDDPRLDEQLASFTDQLLNGTTQGEGWEPEDARLRLYLQKLQQTVVQVHSMIGTMEPDRELNSRIKKQLVSAWYEVKSPPQARSVWQRLRGIFLPEGQGWKSSRGARQAQVLRLAVAAVAILLLLAIFVPGIGSALEGTALGRGGILPIGLLVILVIGVGLWLWRGKSR
ncbi:MAG: hypothetical protein JW726_00265 [Anaerolineales bacterium]|nr:hypothetical protein [Anaerolineales bacterium]